MKSLTEFLNVNEAKLSNLDLPALEEELKSVIDEKIDIKISGISLPARYLTSGLVGTIIEYYFVNKLNEMDVYKFSLGEDTEESIVYGHPDFMINGILAEIKANRNLKRDGIKFTAEQQKAFTTSTPIIWVGYSISGSDIVIDDIKVRTYGQLTANGNRPHKID